MPLVSTARCWSASVAWPSAWVSCQVSQKLRGERLDGALRQRAGGDREARPGENRRREQLDVEFLAVNLHAAGFGARFDHVGPFVVGARVGLEQAVERGVDVVLGTVLQQAVDGFGELGFPVGVFQLAAGFGKSGGQALECKRARYLTRFCTIFDTD